MAVRYRYSVRRGERMPGELPEDPSVREMLEWLMSTWGMTKSDLARMFQRTQSTIHHWLTTGQVSHRNLMKIRSSFYFLHDSRDPHSNERKCERCGKWLPQGEFRRGRQSAIRARTPGLSSTTGLIGKNSFPSGRPRTGTTERASSRSCCAPCPSNRPLSARPLPVRSTRTGYSPQNQL